MAVALLAAGCGTGGVASSGGARPDTRSGQQLFTEKCAACHTLAAAGASGTIGPNLDDAFGSDVKQGLAQSTIENLVLDQIRLGSGQVATYTNNKHFTTTPSMPANLVTGQDAKDVAAYVASVAGTGASGGGSGSIGTSGDAIFKSQCAGCHTLSAAGSSGTVGPNLDQLKPDLPTVVRQVTNGGSIMPAFKGKLTPAQIQAVAKYVSSNAGK